MSSAAATTNSANKPTTWVGRLERRMSKLADTASKESIQALSKWIAFRRTHTKEFSAALASAIADPTTLNASADTTARQWLYLQIVHESIILDSGTSRWERLQEMREILGEVCMMDVAKRNCLDAATTKKVEAMVKQWDSLHAFGVPTLISMIKKQLSAAASSSSTKDTATATATSTTAEEQPKAKAPASPKRERSASPKPTKRAKSPPPKAAEEKETPVETPAKSTPKPEETKPSTTASTTKTPKKNVEYDFEAKGIPYGKVDAKEFLAPCKAIATLQIARDMRNDSAVQISSLLQAMPEDIQKLCEEADAEVKETGQPYELPDQKAREWSMKTSERLLDMDMEEQIQNVRTFIEVVEKQREARQRLIHLLVKSRCRFGATEAAKEFYSLDPIQVELQKRKETLLDAMALEGLDFEEPESPADSKKKKREPELAPLTWYLNEQETNGESEEPPKKKAKVDSK